jgi:hypothetical protein
MTFPKYPEPSPPSPRPPVSLPELGGGNAVARWKAAFRPRTVVFTSPLPTAESSLRLQKATGRMVMGVYVRSIPSYGPGPRLYGTAAPPQFRVALRAARRGSWQPVFDGVIKPAAGGGTILRGAVGPPSSSPTSIVVTAAVLAVTDIGLLAGVVASVLSGSGPDPATLLLPVSVLLAGYIAIAASLPGRIRSDTERLLGELSGILGSTVTMES